MGDLKMNKTVFKLDGKYVIGFTYNGKKMVPWTTDNVKEIPSNLLHGAIMQEMIKQSMDPGQKLETEEVEL